MVTRPRLWLKTTSEKGPHLSCVVFTKSTSHLSRGLFSCGIKMQHALWKPSWRWQGKRGCGAHNTMLKVCNTPQYPQASSPGWPATSHHRRSTSSKKRATLCLRLNITPFPATCSFGIAPLGSGASTAFKCRANSGISEVSLHLASGSLRLVNEN